MSRWARMRRWAWTTTLVVSALLVVLALVGWRMSWVRSASITMDTRDFSSWDAAAQARKVKVRHLYDDAEGPMLSLGRTDWNLAHDRGAVCFYRGSDVINTETYKRPPHGLSWASPVPDYAVPSDLDRVRGIEKWNCWRAGPFALRCESFFPRTWVFIRLPYWIVLLFVALPWWLTLMGIGKRRLRVRRGACVLCGYDMRGLAVGTRCPECGK